MPSQISEETPGADLPDVPAGTPLSDAVKIWQAFADAQTGQLDKANLKNAAQRQIVQSCEARDAAIDAQLTGRKKVLGIF